MAAVVAQQHKPVEAASLVFVEGTFEELALEMAEFLHVTEEVEPLVQNKAKEDVLAKLVQASSSLTTVNEKNFTAAANLMIYLVFQSADPKKYLPSLCSSFSKPVANSPVNGIGLSLNALTTIFNLLPPFNPVRFRVFIEILKYLKTGGMWESLRPYLDFLPSWISEWGLTLDQQRQVYEETADVAKEAGHEQESFQYVLKALRTFDESREELSSEAAQRLALRAVKTALLSSSHFLYQELRSIAAVQALADSHPDYAQLLEIFAEQDLEDFNDFKDEHKDFFEKEGLDAEKFHRKMRLLSFASLAAAIPNREIPYSRIAKALQIEESEVEMWTIDAIRAGLVEGKLSQQKSVFLVHKITFRVFGQRQWQELSTRVDQWKTTLRAVLDNLQQARLDVKAQQEREAAELERKLAAAANGETNEKSGKGGRDRRHNNNNNRDHKHRGDREHKNREHKEHKERNENDD